MYSFIPHYLHKQIGGKTNVLPDWEKNPSRLRKKLQNEGLNWGPTLNPSVP